MRDAKTIHRMRLSLSSLLLLTAVFALSITTAMLWREVGPLRQEVYRLRDEVGELVIRDETKLHAVQVPVESIPARKEWQWRVWWPKNKEYLLRAADESIFEEGFPEPNGWAQLRGGVPTVISVIATKEPNGERWTMRVAYKRSGFGTGSFGGSTVDWVGKSSAATVGGVHQQTMLFEVAEPVVLCRYRCDVDVRSSTDIPDPAGGFMIWLEPVL